MFDSQEYLFTQFDLPMNTLQLPPDIVYQDINSSRSVSPPPIEMELDVKVIKDLKDAINTIQRIDGKHEVIFEPSNHTEKMCKKLVKLVSGIKVLQLHFEFILDIINSISDEEIPEIVKRYDPLSRYSKPITKKNDLCLVAMSHSFDVIMHYLLSEIEKVTDNFFASNDDGSVEVKNDKETLSHVQIIVSKLETILVYFPEAVILEPDDIFAQKKTSEIWKQLQEGCETVTVADKETLKAQLKPLRTFLVVSNAILYRSQKSETKTFKDRFLIALSVVYYSTQKEKAEHHSSLYRAAPKMESAFLVWQFIERGWFKEIMKLALPTMDYDKKIYLGRMFPIIDRETVLKEYEEGSSSKFVENTFVPPDLSSKKEQVIESIFKKNKESVKVRIISPFPLVIQETSSEKARAMAMEAVNKVKEFFNSDKPTVTESDGIIIHVHGGGFTSGSSSSHRSYLYKWARSMNKIIFSIDYRLAPDHPYPAAPDDVWQAYNWIVNYAEPILGIKTKKVILAGDSAGGNLIVSLCLRLAKNGLKMPDGCWLAYPAMNLFPRRFAPSYFLAVEDPFLPYSMLDLCIKAYIPDEFQPRIDPFLSPVIVEDHLLEKLPPLRIMTGSNDPLHDDNWRFLQRMKKLGKDIKMSVYDNMPHGFISFDMIDNYKVILEGTCKMILELFGETPAEPRSPEKRKMTY